MSDYTGKICDYCEEPMLLCPCGLTIHWNKQPCPTCGTREEETAMYTAIGEIQSANDRAGKHFFKPATMRFFRSRIASYDIFHGRYFITSEQFDRDSPRLYTIREAKPDGGIDTVGEFQQYATVRQAKAAAKKLA